LVRAIFGPAGLPASSKSLELLDWDWPRLRFGQNSD
jgi:hypothetical protein